MRPLFLQRAPHPVRSRFSAFPFSLSRASRGSVLLGDGRDDHPHRNLSGKTLTTFPTATWKSGPDRSREDGDGDDEDPAAEPWGHNIGARSARSQPWGQNIGAAVHGARGWELDIMPASAGAVLGTGPRTDGRVERWARPPQNLGF